MWGLIIYTMISIASFSEARNKVEEATAASYEIVAVFQTPEECQREADKFNAQPHYEHAAGAQAYTRRRVADCQEVEKKPDLLIPQK